MINQGNDIRAKIAELVQESWAKIGIDVNIRILEWSTMLNATRKGEFDAVVLGWTTPMDPDQYDIWATERCNENGQNFICFRNEEVDTLLTEAKKEFNFEKRKAYYDRFQEILSDEQPYTFLYFPYTHIALSKRFENVKPARAGITYNFIDWYVKKANQKYHQLTN